MPGTLGRWPETEGAPCAHACAKPDRVFIKWLEKIGLTAIRRGDETLEEKCATSCWTTG